MTRRRTGLTTHQIITFYNNLDGSFIKQPHLYKRFDGFNNPNGGSHYGPNLRAVWLSAVVLTTAADRVMPLTPCRDYMYTGKVRSTEKILSTQRRQIRIDRWCTLQVCHDFAVLEIWSESLDGDKPSRLKVRRAVYEDLLSQNPEKWFLCEIQETWGTTWIAAWNDPHVSEGTQEDQGPHVPMVDHLIATQATLEWLVGMNEEVFFRQSIETIYMVNVLVTWFRFGVSFTKSLRWCRALIYSMTINAWPNRSWRRSCLEFWRRKGIGCSRTLSRWTTPPSQDQHLELNDARSKHMTSSDMPKSPCFDHSKKDQDEVGTDEPPPDVESVSETKKDQEGTGQNEPSPSGLSTLGAIRTQDEVGQNKPPPRVSGACDLLFGSRFYPCSTEHPGARIGSTAMGICNYQGLIPERLVSEGDTLEKHLAKKRQYPLVAAGGAPTWTSARAAFLRPHATLGERFVFAQETEGWMATDEWAFMANRMRRAESHFHFLPAAIYSTVTDEFVFECNEIHIPNTGISLLPILYGAHWMGVEIDKQHQMPEVAILQCPQANQVRLEMFISHILQIPGHRLVIRHWNNTGPPNMCGWSLVWRWMVLSHAQHTFARTLSEFQGLADDRKRIIARVLEKSAQAWAQTQANTELQQVAYTIRQAFLTHLFQFNTSVHTRLDTLAICAAGHPLSVFGQSTADSPERQISTVATQTTELTAEEQNLAIVPVHHNIHVHAGAQTDFLGEEFGGLRISQSGPGLQRTRTRVQEFCVYPALAASDELDYTIDICRHFAGHVNFLPCCMWQPGANDIEVISNRRPNTANHLEHRFLVARQHHWFAVHVLFDGGLVWIHVYGFPSQEAQDFPAFLQALARFLQVRTHRIRAHQFPYDCPDGMCGFKMLQGCFDAADVTFMPSCEESVHQLQTHQWAEDFAYIGRYAVRAWRLATQDHFLIQFAFAVRTLFLAHLMQTQWVDRHVRGGGPEITWRPGQPLPPLKHNTRSTMADFVRKHHPVEALCHCHTRGVSAEAIVGSFAQTWNEYDLVTCRLCSPHVVRSKCVGDMDFSWPECTHDKSTFAFLSLPSRLRHLIGQDRRIFIIEARLLWVDGKCIIDVRAPQAGIMPMHPDNPDKQKPIRIGEFFAGGFSGWSFAAKTLTDAFLPVKQVFSIENDILAAKVHARNHSNFPPIGSSDQAFDLGETGEPPKEHLTIVANIEHGWWCHLVEPIDILAASPPCQPWSRAGAERGLDCEEGRLIIYAIIQCTFLQPAVIVLEEVASVFAHTHAPWIIAFFDWAGYEIIWKENLNLLEVMPQSRTRLMLVAVRKGDARIKRLAPGSWKKADLAPTLKSILLPDTDVSHEFTPNLSAKTFEMYFQIRLLPQGTGTTPYQIRKCRIKTVQDPHPCIMASYSKSHELPIETLYQKGLLGAFVIHNGRVRLLSIAEVTLLFGSAHPVYMPCDARIAYHLLGNAIAVPHASLGLINGIAQMTSIDWTQVPTWIVEDLLSMRLTAQDTMSRLDQSKQMLIIERNPVSPTESWEEERCHFNALRITQGKATLVIRMTKEVQVLAILRILYHTPTNANLQWQPRGDASTKLPLFMEDTIPADGMHIVDFMTGPLSLEEHMFVSRKSDYVIALTPSGIFVMLRSKMGAIEDIIEALNPHFQQTMICQDHLGRMHGLETHPPDLVFVMPQTNPVEVDLDKLMKHQWTPNQDRAVIDLSMHDALWLLHQFTVLGWSDIIRALGWKTVLDSHPGNGITSPKQVQLSMTRCRNASGVALQALLNVLTTRLTLLLLNQAEPPESTGFAVQVKLWDSYIWEGMVTPETLSGKFASAWSKAASCFGRHDELRTIIRGRRTNPDWTIQHYLDDNATRDRPLRIHLILQLEGGGTKAEAAAKLKDDFTERVLQLGYDPIEAKQFVTQLYQEAGAARLRHVLALKEEEAFVQQCTLLSQQTRIKLPERFDLEAERTKKIKLQWRSKVAEPFPVNPAELTVEPGTFCRADDTEVKMQEQVGPQEAGIVFVDATEIVAFARKVRQTPPNELLAIVPGTQCPLQDSACNKLNLQVRTRADEKIIIAACCHSIGKNPIKHKVSPGDEAKVTESTKAMFVVWRHECPEETWMHLIEAPIQTVFKQLQIVPSEVIAGAPVGRSWRANRQAVDPNEADSFCFYARILTSMLTPVLKKSGLEGMYITPKSEHSTLADSRFNVIWTGATTGPEALTQAEKLECALGVVRSSKERPTYGVRVWAKDFNLAWQTLKPGETQPQQFAGEYLYKISPLPEGVTAEDIQAWITLEKLPAKPLRALSSSTWLLIGQERIERHHLTWKRNAIMLKQIDSKYNRGQQTVLAASTQFTPTYKTRRTWKADKKESEPIDPFTVSDPWAQAKANIWSNDPWWPSPSVTNASSSSSKAESTRSSNSNHGEQQQEIDAMKNQITALEKAVHQQNKDTAGLRKEVHNEFAAVRREVTDVKASFQQTLTAALGQTQEVLQRGFKEDFESLKALLSGKSRKRGDRDEDMEG